MKVTRIYLVVGILCLLGFFNSSCHKNLAFERNYFAFGSAYSECEGNCATFFLVEDDDVYPDDVEWYSGNGNDKLKFKKQELSDDKFAIAQKLISDFPESLNQSSGGRFGCPDCRDQGGYHIEMKTKGKVKKWHFDADLSQLPPDLQPYVVELKQTIAALSK